MTKETMIKLTLAIEDFNRAQTDEENHLDIFEVLGALNKSGEDEALQAIEELKQNTKK